MKNWEKGRVLVIQHQSPTDWYIDWFMIGPIKAEEKALGFSFPKTWYERDQPITLAIIQVAAIDAITSAVENIFFKLVDVSGHTMWS
jgi:hypothetical protein